MRPTWLLFGAALWGIVASAQSPLEPYGLDALDCSPVLTTPCFRLQFKVAGVRAAPPADLTVWANDRPAQVTYSRVADDILQVTTVSPYPDLASLGGRAVDFAVSWKQPDGTSAEGKVRWASGDMGAVLSDRCDGPERRNAPRHWSSAPQWRPLFVFFVYAGLWAIAMFLVPRRLWPPAPAEIRPLRRNPRGPG